MNLIVNTACIMVAAGMMGSAVIAQYKTAGSVNYQHLLLNYDARSVGLAGASVALPDGLNGVTANPAMIAGLNRQQGFIGYQLVLDGVWAAPVGYARSYAGIGAFSIVVQGLSSGKVDVIEEGPDGEPKATGLTAHDEYFTPGVSFARSFFNARLLTGISLKGLYHRISAPPDIYSSKGIAVDIGIQYRPINDRLIFGAVIRNAGFEFAPFEDGRSYPLPVLFEAGVSYVPRYLPALRIAADINKIRGEYVNFEPGLEIAIYPDVFFARLGFMFSQGDLTEQFHKFTGDQDENYVKSNWATLATGIGLHTDLNAVFLRVDFGLQFRASWLPPSPVLSAIIEF
ncbi:MAG: hypothetical protein JXA18_07235 [Chitinispirillaceae bacterium]|nr:hypothetical protein [Chitinispirillaceae bacterium]